MRILVIEDEAKVVEFVARSLREDQFAVGISNYELADLEMVKTCDYDRLSQQVMLTGKRIELNSEEYGLLEYLITNVGWVLSCTMIIEHVWGESFEGLTNMVAVYIRHLHAKIDTLHPQKLIGKARGVGYIVSDESET